ncbi:hypothetical protein SMD44_p10144 (plasmid) [Streptomyces alboflavus]|uniref:2'-5' RNA ligase n=1 Tax=Streptomyces alboflavus TaxID=67267 RepID=A0A291W413_9ACTN|nr:2'-5' RNA ligase family protein [Streptomyces alboflavus]ATM24643.1 hypothetical protein SMD44_p10144 [Streptomyces alboflavus]
MTPELDVDPGTFPHCPPSDLNTPGQLVEHDWRAFAAVERMTDHWARPGWADGARAYYWMLTFPEATDLWSRAQQCQDQLAHLGMDPVPADGLHVTLTRIGSTDEVSDVQIRLLADRAQDLLLPDFQLAAHPLAGSHGAVRFTLAPWTPLVRLHAALSGIGQQVGVPGGKPTSAFRPHLGVQYNNRQRPAAPVIESVALLRTLEPVPLKIRNVELVELWRTAGALPAYRWHVVRSVPLRPQQELPVLPGGQQG